MYSQDSSLLAVSAFQLLDAAECFFTETWSKKPELAEFPIEIYRIANFYTDTTLGQVLYKPKDNSPNQLILSIEVRSSAQKDGISAFKISFKTETENQQQLYVVRDVFDISIEAKKIALYLNLYVTKSIQIKFPESNLSTSIEQAQLAIKEQDNNRVQAKRALIKSAPSQAVDHSYAPKDKAENIASSFFSSGNKKESDSGPLNINPNDILGQLLGSGSSTPASTKTDSPLDMSPEDLMKDLMGSPQPSTPSSESTEEASTPDTQELT